VHASHLAALWWWAACRMLLISSLPNLLIVFTSLLRAASLSFDRDGQLTHRPLFVRVQIFLPSLRRVCRSLPCSIAPCAPRRYRESRCRLPDRQRCRAQSRHAPASSKPPSPALRTLAFTQKSLPDSENQLSLSRKVSSIYLFFVFLWICGGSSSSVGQRLAPYNRIRAVVCSLLGRHFSWELDSNVCPG
jgi:hypothetical protein